MQQQSQQQFRQDEIITMSHWDKAVGAHVTTPYPKIGGRLRIAHESNDQLSIISKIVSYDGCIAVVQATATTDKGTYSGVGMASLERDAKIAPAILELAESRAIARSLRFCGIGVEYCGAEEISHLAGDNGARASNGDTRVKQIGTKQGFTPAQLPAPNARPEPTYDIPQENGSSVSRLSGKQLVYIMRLANGRSFTKKDLDTHCINVFGVATDFLTKKEASTLIEELNHPKEEQHA